MDIGYGDYSNQLKIRFQGSNQNSLIIENLCYLYYHSYHSDMYFTVITVKLFSNYPYPLEEILGYSGGRG